MTSVAVIINSCYKFHKTTIPYMVDSIKHANIPRNNIYIVVGESDNETDIMQMEDYNIVYCKYVNIDYNGVIYFTQTQRGLQELQKYTHFFYMHDTCIFLNCFWDNILLSSNQCDSYVKLTNYYSVSTGLLNVNWFIQNKKELFSYFINYDKELILAYKASNYPNNNLIYSKFTNLPQYLGEDSIFVFNDFVPVGDFFNFVDRVPSFIMRVYSNEERKGHMLLPGIIKFNKNWKGGEPDFKWNLNL